MDISSVGAALKILRLLNRMNETRAVRHLGCARLLYIFSFSIGRLFWQLGAMVPSNPSASTSHITEVHASPCCSKKQPCEHRKRVKLLLTSSKSAIPEALSPSLPHELSNSLVCKFPGDKYGRLSDTEAKTSSINYNNI